MRGFIALFSILIVSTVSLMSIATAGVLVFFAQSNVLGEVSYRRSQAAAYTCVQLVLHSISVDEYRFKNGTPAQFTVNDTDTCEVISVTLESTRASLEISGSSGSSHSILRAGGVRASAKGPFTLSSFEYL
jgi:hypothetical protein